MILNCALCTSDFGIIASLLCEMCFHVHNVHTDVSSLLSNSYKTCPLGTCCNIIQKYL